MQLNLFSRFSRIVSVDLTIQFLTLDGFFLTGGVIISLWDLKDTWQSMANEVIIIAIVHLATRIHGVKRSNN